MSLLSWLQAEQATGVSRTTSRQDLRGQHSGALGASGPGTRGGPASAAVPPLPPVTRQSRGNSAITSAAAQAAAQEGASTREGPQQQGSLPAADGEAAMLPAAGQQAFAPPPAELTPGFHEMRHSLSQSEGAPEAYSVLPAVVDASAAEAATGDKGVLHCMPRAKMQSVVAMVQHVTQGTSSSHAMTCPI